MCRPGKFHTAGVLQHYLARKITIDARQALGIAAASDDEGIEAYGHSVQSELANPYSLIQQGIEMALKGRIATASRAGAFAKTRADRSPPSGIGPESRPSSKARSHRRAARPPRLGLSDMLKLQVLDLHLLPFAIGGEGRDSQLHSESETGSVT